jgi:hypothetical protein
MQEKTVERLAPLKEELKFVEYLFNTRETVEKPPLSKIGGTNRLK